MMMSSEARNPFSVFIWISPFAGDAAKYASRPARSGRAGKRERAASAGLQRGCNGMTTDTDHSGCTSKEFEVTPTRLVVPKCAEVAKLRSFKNATGRSGYRRLIWLSTASTGRPPLHRNLPGNSR